MDAKRKKTCSVRFEPSGLKAEVEKGTTLLEAAHKVGVYLTSICGGDGYCGKCKAIIETGQFESRPTTLLTQDEIRNNTVLACQTKVLSDLAVQVPKSHSLGGGQILMDSDVRRFSQLSGESAGDAFEYDPLIRKLHVKMSHPTVSDHTADSREIGRAHV